MTNGRPLGLLPDRDNFRPLNSKRATCVANSTTIARSDAAGHCTGQHALQRCERWVGNRWARREESDRLSRVVATLSDANFPLQESVLQKLAGLSGAEFVVWDAQQQAQAATLPLDADERDRLKAVPETGPLSDLSSNPLVEIQGRNFLTAKVPLRRTATRPLSLLVLYPEDRWWTATRGAVLPPLIAGGVTALVALVLTAWWARRFTRPIARLSHQSESIASGDFQPMTLPTRDDELRDLTLSINRMVEQLTRYEQQVRRNERLKTLGQLGAGLAHQLRNWLTGARWRASPCASARSANKRNRPRWPCGKSD